MPVSEAYSPFSILKVEIDVRISDEMRTDVEQRALTVGALLDEKRKVGPGSRSQASPKRSGEHDGRIYGLDDGAAEAGERASYIAVTPDGEAMLGRDLGVRKDPYLSWPIAISGTLVARRRGLATLCWP